mgnify:CR=1 FL=1
MTQYEILKQYFGYDTFRDGQDVLIQSILEGRDVLGVMAHRGRKIPVLSNPGLMMEGITLVISPLISLMKDQVSNLNQVGILAAYINSSLTAAQYYKVLDLARAGRYPIIYVAPERLMSEDFLRFALSKPGEDIHGSCGRGPLCIPVGPGFQAQLSENSGFHQPASGQACCKRIYSHCHSGSAG